MDFNEIFDPKWRSFHSKLKEFIFKNCYREGDFTLASGKKSSFYLDMKPATLTAESSYWIGLLGVASLKRWSSTYRKSVGGVGGLTLGADPIATAVSLVSHLEGVNYPAFLVRKEPKGHGTGKQIEGLSALDPKKSIVVVEDVVTTGGSSLKAIQALKEAGQTPELVWALVDREQGGKEAFLKEGVQLISLFKLSEIQDLKQSLA